MTPSKAAAKRGLSRRCLLAALASAATACAKKPGPCAANPPLDWCEQKFPGRSVYMKSKDGGPAVVLLHEINGMSPGCIDFGNHLVKEGFSVYMPLLFGHWNQNDIIFGYLESCAGAFSCFETAPKDSKIPTVPPKEGEAAAWLRDFVKQLPEGPSSAKGIGVIGMCLSGALPLCVMPQDKVRAVVMSQPALPFGGSTRKQRSVGLSETTMQDARKSGKPIRAFRFCADTICGPKRFAYLHDYFGQQFNGTELPRPEHYHPGFFSNLTHRLHAVLTGDFGEVTEQARQQVFVFLREHLV